MKHFLKQDPFSNLKLATARKFEPKFDLPNYRPPLQFAAFLWHLVMKIGLRFHICGSHQGVALPWQEKQERASVQVAVQPVDSQFGSNGYHLSKVLAIG